MYTLIISFLLDCHF